MSVPGSPEDLRALLSMLEAAEERARRAEEKAEEALVRASSVERQVSVFLDMMGWSYEPLPTDSEGVRKLLQEIDDTLARSPNMVELTELQKWARVLLRLSPGYLSLVAQQQRLDTPWRPFLDLAHHLIQKADVDQVASAPLLYGALDVARRNAQQAGFLWGAEQQGRLPAPPMVLGETLEDRVLELHTYLFRSR